MSVTVKHTSAALTDILLAADKLWEGCLSNGGGDSCGTLGRDVKPHKLRGLIEHHGCDGAIPQAATRQSGSRLALCVFTKVRDLLPKGWNWTREENITHKSYSKRAWGMEGWAPRHCWYACNMHFSPGPQPTRWWLLIHRLCKAKAKGQVSYPLLAPLLWGGLPSCSPKGCHRAAPVSASLEYRAEILRKVTVNSHWWLKSSSLAAAF